MTVATSPALRWRVHRVVAELDARGEIDRHAAMCLRHAIREVRTSVIEMVLVDLRDLTAIDSAGLTLFSLQRGDCLAHGVELGLLISGRERDAQLAEAFVLAGLGETLHYFHEPAVPVAADQVGLRLRTRVARAPRLVRAAARLGPRRQRPSRPA